MPTGLPRGHVPRYTPPADNGHLFGSYSAEARRLERAASDAEWVGDFTRADALRAELASVRDAQAMTTSDMMPLF
jgi:hypothetical protein